MPLKEEELKRQDVPQSPTEELRQEEQASIEEALRESEERFRTLYNNTPVMMHSIDDDGKLVMVNDYWLEVLGYERDEVIGQRSVDFLTEEYRKIAVEVNIPHLRKTGVAKDVEYQFVKKSGEIIDVLLSAEAELDEDGKIVYSRAFLIDVTDRKRAEEALRESEERISAILGSAMDAIVIVDDDRRILTFNEAAEKTFCCKADEAIGAPFDRFLTPDFSAALDEASQAFEAEGIAHRFLLAPEGLTAMRADGERFPAEATLSRVEVGGQQLSTIILRDTEERAKAEARLETLEHEKVYLQEKLESTHNFGQIVASSPTMHEVFRSIRKVAATDSTVLITGETGTGKELVARAIHESSGRAERVLVTVNCAALPASLIESELFGHEKGAFTGAIAKKAGRFELAHGGTLFLDEIADLPLELQAKLLRALQEGEFERVGSSKTRKVDVRVIAATNQALDEAVSDGRFRTDLYYRLNVFPIHVPALRERKEDIPLLARHFALAYGSTFGKKIETIPRKGLDSLQAYDWPGNVRELENVIERAVIITDGPELNLGNWLPTALAAAPGVKVPTLDEMARNHITEVLELTGWRVRGTGGAAELLDLKPTTLEAKMKKLEIERNK